MAEIPDVATLTTISSDWGNDIRDRTIQRYSSVANRTTEHATPTEGDLSYLEDSNDVDVYNGSSWVHLGTPSGAVEMYAGSSVPDGWLLCNGQAVSRTTYATLFGAIGTTWGAGNGSTTFNVPNMVDRYPRGAGATALGGSVGADTHTHTGPSHTHSFSDSSTAAQSGPFGGTGFAVGSIEHIHGVSGTTGAGGTANTGSSSTLPASRGIHYIIKT